MVRVGGLPARSPDRQVGPDEPLAVADGGPRFVSRGGEKLDAALERFRPPVAGARILDAGASTGGFTDCLLQRGAAEVVAVDVGHGQLHWRLRTEPRVRVHERTNIRSLSPDVIGGPVDGVVADLSFISLRTVAAPLAACARPDAWFVLLVKPQFEAGRERVGRGGVVRDPTTRRAVLDAVAEAFDAVGVTVLDALASPLPGPAGNREVFLHARKAAPGPADLAARLDRAVREGGP